MKKPAAPATTKPAAPAASSTTLTARFSEEERTVIERAATILRCSSARLLKDAAIRRATDVVNADGPNRKALLRLCDELVADLYDPRFRFDGDLDSDECRWSESDIERKADLSFHLAPKGPDPVKMESVLSALRTSPTEFAMLLIERLSEARDAKGGCPAYSPVIVNLGGTATEEEEEP